MQRTPSFVDRAINWAPVLLLGSLAALTYWLDAQVQPPAPRVDGLSRHDPDTFVLNLRALSFGPDGLPRQAMSAQRTDHFPDNDTIDFVAPSLRLTDPGKPAVGIVAAKATLAGDRETIAFSGNVRGTREAVPAAANGGKAEGPVTMTTEFLRVMPREGKASTDQPVTIEEPRGIIHATGMDLDNQARTIRFKSAFHGTISPNSLPK
jgi:lipopolysaccharide export system protein LptC